MIVCARSPDNRLYNLLFDQQEAFAKRVERASIMLVLPNFDGPIKADSAVQRARTAAMEKLSDRVAGTAMVVLVPGLKGTTLRLILTAAMTVSGGQIPMHIFADILGGLGWLKGLPRQPKELTMEVGLAHEIAALAASVKQKRPGA